MIRIGETIISEDTTEEVREAITYRIEGLKKTRKKNEDEKVFAGVRECDSKISCLRDTLRLIDPTGQIDGIAVVERGAPDDQQDLLDGDGPEDGEPNVTAEQRQKALEIVGGLEGNKGRQEAIEKRIAILEGGPEGRYDLTQARKKAIEVLVNSVGHFASISNRTTLSPKGSTVATKVVPWLSDERLVDLHGEGVVLTEQGCNLAAELGYGPGDQKPAAETPEERKASTDAVPAEVTATDDEPIEHDVVDPGEDDFSADLPEEDEGLKPAAVGAYEDLEDDTDLV